MSIVVNTNIQSLIGQNSLNKNTNSLNSTLEKLSTGLKINSAKDDAAGLGVVSLMTAQIRGNSQAMANIQDATNLIQTAEGGLEIITDNIQRIRELCIQAANEIYDENSKQSILNEIDQRLRIVDQIANTTNFNGKKLLDGNLASLYIQIGPNGDLAPAGQTEPTQYLNAIDVAPSLTNGTSEGLGIAMKITALGNANATHIDATTWTTQNVRDYIDKLDTALTKISNDRSVMGAYMNAMDSAAANLTSINISLESARSTLLDADVATLSSDMVRYQILQQTSTSVLAQANQMPALALTLLGS